MAKIIDTVSLIKNLEKTLFSSYKRIIIIYIILFFGLTWSYLLLGEVIAPNRQYSEIAKFDITGNSNHQTNQKFSDFNRVYIPEATINIRSNQSGWLPLWTSKNELGRPTYHISGLSPANFLSWVISNITKSPWQFITILSLLTSFLTGLFIILYCKEKKIFPLSSLIAGMSLAASPMVMYWLTFPMFSATLCWASGILWSLTRLDKKQDIISWGALTFCIYNILMTAYPQIIVFHIYILVAYGLFLVYQKFKNNETDINQFILLTTVAVIIGVILSAPIYIDLFHTYLESARVRPQSSYFTEILPKINSLSDALKIFTLSTIPELIGNPTNSNYPFPYNGISITPLMLFFLIIGLFSSFKKIWGWLIVVIILFLLTFIQSIFIFGVDHLGFHLSRNLPLSSSLIPVTIIIAYGVNSLIERSNQKKISLAIQFSTIAVLSVIIIDLFYSIQNTKSTDFIIVPILLTLVGLFSTQHNKTRPYLLFFTLLITLRFFSYPLMLHQDPSHIATTSDLVKNIQKNLPLNSKFALVDPSPHILQPNFNAGLGLASIHSYNSLSPLHYHTLIKKLGGEMITYGRLNLVISPNFNSNMFWMSNISLVLSRKRLQHENLQYIGSTASVYLHKVLSRMGESSQIIPPGNQLNRNNLEIPDIQNVKKLFSIVRTDQGDLLEFDVTPAQSSTLILSQKYHRNWQAQVLTKKGWTEADTLIVNNVFQGVNLPRNVSKVRLEFKPYARFAWIAHVFWLLLMVIIVIKYWRVIFNSTLENFQNIKDTDNKHV